MDFGYCAPGRCACRGGGSTERKWKRAGVLSEGEHQCADCVAARLRFTRSTSGTSAHVQEIRDPDFEIDYQGAAPGRTAVVHYCWHGRVSGSKSNWQEGPDNSGHRIGLLRTTR